MGLLEQSTGRVYLAGQGRENSGQPLVHQNGHARRRCRRLHQAALDQAASDTSASARRAHRFWLSLSLTHTHMLTTILIIVIVSKPRGISFITSAAS